MRFWVILCLLVISSKTTAQTYKEFSARIGEKLLSKNKNLWEIGGWGTHNNFHGLHLDYLGGTKLYLSFFFTPAHSFQSRRTRLPLNWNKRLPYPETIKYTRIINSRLSFNLGYQFYTQANTMKVPAEIGDFGSIIGQSHWIGGGYRIFDWKNLQLDVNIEMRSKDEVMWIIVHRRLLGIDLNTGMPEFKYFFEVHNSRDYGFGVNATLRYFFMENFFLSYSVTGTRYPYREHARSSFHLMHFNFWVGVRY